MYIPFYKAGVRQDKHSKRAQTDWAISNKKSQHDSSLESAMETDRQKVTITKYYLLTLYETVCSTGHPLGFHKQVQIALWRSAQPDDL